MTRSIRRNAREGAGPRARPTIPERGLKIGEAARTIGVETYVLRFWETQFPFLKPRHANSKHRFYGERELRVLGLIRRLLHEQGFTIAGANKHIRACGIEELLEARAPAIRSAASESGRTGDELGATARRTLAEVRRDLESIHKLLSE